MVAYWLARAIKEELKEKKIDPYYFDTILELLEETQSKPKKDEQIPTLITTLKEKLNKLCLAFDTLEESLIELRETLDTAEDELDATKK